MVDILPDDAPAPRLCHLIKWPDFDGYGFNLHAERSNPGQFVGKIDEASPAQLAGLKEGDRIVEVNGVNINNENHRQVVERIKSEARETRLLVVDPETDAWYKEQDLVVKSSQLNVIYIRTPVPRPQQQASIAAAEQQQQQPTTTDNETSDFNDDSIEQPVAHVEATNQQVAGETPEARPPMSPDSGKGDDEPATANGELSVEAEIHRQDDEHVQIVGQYLGDRAAGVEQESRRELGEKEKEIGKPANSDDGQTEEQQQVPANDGQQQQLIGDSLGNHQQSHTTNSITTETTTNSNSITRDHDDDHDDGQRVADRNKITNANSVASNSSSSSSSSSEDSSQLAASNNELNELQQDDERRIQPDSLNNNNNQTDTSDELSSTKQPTSQQQMDELGCQPDSLSDELASSRPSALKVSHLSKFHGPQI